jgi:hypothetical protein
VVPQVRVGRPEKSGTSDKVTNHTQGLVGFQLTVVTSESFIN